MNIIPRQARDGLTRAWIEILHERHPTVAWIATDPTAERDASKQESARHDPQGRPETPPKPTQRRGPIALHSTT